MFSRSEKKLDEFLIHLPIKKSRTSKKLRRNRRSKKKGSMNYKVIRKQMML
jgi:hypothetical protein